MRIDQAKTEANTRVAKELTARKQKQEGKETKAANERSGWTAGRKGSKAQRECLSLQAVCREGGHEVGQRRKRRENE